MNDEINYKSNPLHGVSLKAMLTELVDHYGFDILHAYLGINCFKTNPSVASSVKFLNKTDWARENLENFYLYQFKHLPRASAEQYSLSPRDRVIPEDQQPGTPAALSLEDAERLRMKREKKAAGFRSGPSRPHAAPRSRGSHPRENKRAGGIRDDAPKAEGSPVWGNANPWSKRKT